MTRELDSGCFFCSADQMDNCTCACPLCGETNDCRCCPDCGANHDYACVCDTSSGPDQ